MLAALLNALRVVGKRIEEIKVVTTGVGAAGVAVTDILLNAGVRTVIGCDHEGAIYDGREGLNPVKQSFAERTNPDCLQGTADELLAGADVYLGLSMPGAVSRAGIERMADDAIVFAMANPTPEIAPEDLPPGKVAVVATGRSDYPNQINNVLAFPGVFRGALDVRASTITEGMKVAAGHAIASVIADDELGPEYVIPSVFNRDVALAVAAAVARGGRGGRRRAARCAAESCGGERLKPLPSLLVLQRLERVELRGAPGREDRGEDPDDDRRDREDDRAASTGSRTRSP